MAMSCKFQFAHQGDRGRAVNSLLYAKSAARPSNICHNITPKNHMRRFDEIRLPNKQVVRWRFIDRENRWEIAAYRIPTGSELLQSVTGEPIQKWSAGGPSTEEFSEALGMVVMSASLRVQSDRINGRRNLH